MLALLVAEFKATPAAIGLVPTLTTLGYALGIGLLAPLGDRSDRRRIIVGKAAALVLALLLAACAPSLAVLTLASLAIGLAATLAQDIVPAAATLAPEAQRGKTVGTVMTGLLLGILLSRVVAGVVAEQFGWRSMFVVAALGIALLGAAMWRLLPRFVPTAQLPYLALLGSLATLWKRHPALRRAAIAQGLVSIGLQRLLVDAGHHAARRALQPGQRRGRRLRPGRRRRCIGRAAGRPPRRPQGPEVVTRLGAALVAAAFIAMAFGPNQLWLIALGAVVLRPGRASDADRAPDPDLRHRARRAQPPECRVVHRHVQRHGERRLAGQRGPGPGRLAGRVRDGRGVRRGRAGGAHVAREKTRALRGLMRTFPAPIKRPLARPGKKQEGRKEASPGGWEEGKPRNAMAKGLIEAPGRKAEVGAPKGTRGGQRTLGGGGIEEGGGWGRRRIGARL